MNLRVENIFFENFKNDKSFLDKESPLKLLFGGTKYSSLEMRETFHRGIKVGIEVGLNEASIEGQIIQLNQNTEEKHKVFLEKLYALCDEHNCSIIYHPEVGMVAVDRGIR